MKKVLLLFFMFFLCTRLHAQEVSYDTTYQVTYENGIKDSVVIIYKTIKVTEKVYLVDSSAQHRWTVDVSVTPFFSTLSTTSSFYSASDVANHKTVSSHTGQSIGANLSYQVKNVAFRFGFECSRHSIKLKNEQNRYSQVSTAYWENDTLDEYYSVDKLTHDTTYFYVIEQLEKTKTSTVTTRQHGEASFRLYYMSFNLLAGYRKNYRNWDLYLYGGSQVAFVVTSRGESFNEKGESRSIQQEKISSPVFYLQSAIQVSYKSTEHLQWYVEPYAQKQLFNVNPTEVQLYNSDAIGCKLGLKIFL